MHLFDFLGSLFKHSFWLVIIVVLCILGAANEGCENLKHKHQMNRINSFIERDRTEKLSDYLHEYFIDNYDANPQSVGHRMGAIAEDAIRCCVENGDSVSARRIYREYEHGLSTHALKEFEGLKPVGDEK